MNFTRLLTSHRTPRTLAVAGLLLALGASMAPAKDKEGKHLDRMVARMEKELKLSKEQTAQVRGILAKNHEAAPPRHSWKREYDCKEGDDCGPFGHGRGPGLLGGAGFAAPDFAAQLRAESVDTAALNRAFAARSDSMRARMQEHHARRVATFAELHAVLTPEQRALAADKWEKRAAEMEKKREKKSKKK